jgi:hypothetical protein
MYLFQFDLNVKHKSKWNHVISNVLSRFSYFENENFKNNHNDDILNDIKTYVEILIKMFSTFKNRLIEDYKKNKQWFFLYVMLKNLHNLIQIIRRRIINCNVNTFKKSQNKHFDQNHEKTKFERRNNFIYHLNQFISKTYLCISKSLLQKIFKMTNDDFAHVDFHRVYVAISKALYILWWGRMQSHEMIRERKL